MPANHTLPTAQCARYSWQAGSHGIPENEMEMAADLYTALQRFFKLHPHLAQRPLIIAGESYAGK